MLIFNNENKSDSILFSIEEIVKKDKEIFNLINNKLNLNLNYYGLNELVNEELLVKAPGSKFSNLVKYILKVNGVQQQLVRASDLVK